MLGHHHEGPETGRVPERHVGEVQHQVPVFSGQQSEHAVLERPGSGVVDLALHTNDGHVTETLQALHLHGDTIRSRLR
jgi:hypothetical protein